MLYKGRQCHKSVYKWIFQELHHAEAIRVPYILNQVTDMALMHILVILHLII